MHEVDMHDILIYGLGTNYVLLGYKHSEDKPNKRKKREHGEHEEKVH